MGRIEIRGIKLTREKDLKKIPGQSEKEFARLILSKPNLECWYEPTRFEYQNGGPYPESTVPDFRILNTITGVETYVEITTSPYGNGKDPKAKQKRVMENAHEENDEAIRYVVLYADNLLKIQNANPSYDLLSHVNGKVRGNKK